MKKKFTDQELRNIMEEIATQREKISHFFEIARKPIVWIPLIIFFILFGPLMGSNPVIHWVVQYLLKLITNG